MKRSRPQSSTRACRHQTKHQRGGSHGRQKATQRTIPEQLPPIARERLSQEKEHIQQPVTGCRPSSEEIKESQRQRQKRIRNQLRRIKNRQRNSKVETQLARTRNRAPHPEVVLPAYPTQSRKSVSHITCHSTVYPQEKETERRPAIIPNSSTHHTHRGRQPLSANHHNHQRRSGANHRRKRHTTPNSYYQLLNPQSGAVRCGKGRTPYLGKQASKQASKRSLIWFPQ